MNFNELKSIVDALDRTYRDDEKENIKVCIPITVIGTVGGTPVTEIARIDNGFDWDKDKLMFIPSKPLREIDRDEIKSIREKYDDYASVVTENKRLKRELKNKNKEIK